MAKQKKPRQARLPFAREPRKGRRGEKRGNVPHRRRTPLSKDHPAFITARLLDGLPNLRTKACYRVLSGALASGCDRFGMRLVEFSIQRDHLHFIVEADDRESLSRGLQGLFVRIAKRLNKLWGRKGQVFAERYHDRILSSPLEVRYALRYVLQNAKKHGHKLTGVDPFSSGIWFDGWKEGSPDRVVPPRFVMTARTWLLRVGWRKHGLISVREAPAG